MSQQKPTVTLASGRKVEIAPMPYEAWEALELERLDLLEQTAADPKSLTSLAASSRYLHKYDQVVVAARVPKWEEVKKELTRDEYLELARVLTERSAKEAEPENLSGGGGGAPTEAAPGSADPAAANPQSGDGSPTAEGAGT